MTVAKRSAYSRPGARPAFERAGAEKPSWWPFGAFTIAVIIRVSIPNNLLNIFEQYSDSYNGSGSVFEKIHPGAFCIFMMTAFVLPRILARWLNDDDGIVRSMFIMSTAIFVVIMICLFTGQTASLGYLVDSLFVACAAACAALCFTVSQRRLLGNALLAIIVLSSIIAIMEVAANKRFLPNNDAGLTLNDLMVRGQGLFSHPLTLALCNAIAIPTLFLTNWARPIKAAALLILVIGIFAAGARAALITTILMAFFGLIIGTGRGLAVQQRIVTAAFVIVGVLVLASLLWFIASSAGFTERFEQEGLVDDSTMARIIIFQIFGYMDWNDLIWGVGNFALFKFTWLGLNLTAVENSLITYVFQFGIIGTLCLVGALLNTLFALGRHTQLPVKMALCSFIVVAFANNTMSSKSPALLLIFMLAIAFRDTVTAQRRAFATSKLGRKRLAALPARVRSAAG